MNYKIRKATLEDSKYINNLLTQLIKDEKQYDSNINENFIVKRFYEYVIPFDSNLVLVALDNDKIVGYLYGYIINSGDTYLVRTSKLEALYVTSEYRKKGIGTCLINEFKKWSLNNGIKCIEVQVLNDNTNAVNLYTQKGFKILKSILIYQANEGEEDEIK